MKLADLSTHHVVSVAPQDSVEQAIAIMDEHGVHHLPVLSGRQVVGIVSDRDIMIGCGGPTERMRSQGQPLVLGNVEDVMTTPVTTLSPDDALRSATWLMIHQRVHAIPLMHRDRLVGIVTDSDLLRGVMASPEFLHQSFLEQSVVTFMHDKVTTVGAKTPLYDVVDVMHQERIHHLPVVIGNELLGIVSDRDVRRALASSTLRDAEAQENGEFYLGPSEAHEVMTKDVRTIPSTATAERAIAELLRHGIHALPIVDARQLQGIITDTDLLRAIGAEDKEATEQ
jgi:CBS-domain-containing membrane protein